MFGILYIVQFSSYFSHELLDSCLLLLIFKIVSKDIVYQAYVCSHMNAQKVMHFMMPRMEELTHRLGGQGSSQGFLIAQKPFTHPPWLVINSF